MGILDEVKPTAGNESRNGYFPPVEATYKVRVERCKTNKDDNAFIVELEVLESSTDEVEPGEFKDWYRSTVAQPGKGWQRDKAAKEILTFIQAACGFDPDKPAEREAFFNQHAHGGKLYDAAIKSNQLDSATLTLRTNIKKTKAGGDFTNHLWSPCADKAPPADKPQPNVIEADWQRDESGTYALNPHSNAWHVVATGLPA